MAGASDSPELGPFLERLEGAVQNCSAEELREWVLAFGRQLDGDRRSFFLDHLQAHMEKHDREEGNSRSSLDASELLDTIDNFREDLEDGRYFDGYGWDDQLQRKRSFGDQSWVWIMDELFDRVSEAFLDGQYDIARKGYERLLNAFYLNEEPGHFCGPDSPTEMVETDVREAACRYLRCVYLTICGESGWVERFWDTYRDLYGTSFLDVDLASIRAADQEDLPEFDTFLECSHAVLQKSETDSRSWNRERPRLLREVSERSSGTDGLKEVARREGAEHPDAYHEWVQSLKQSGKIEEAIDAAKEAVERIKSDVQQAKMADTLALLCRKHNQPADAVEARRMAWRTHPNLYRLRALASEDWPRPDAFFKRISNEYTAVREERYELDPALRSKLAMLTRDQDRFIEEANHEAVGPVLPVLLLAGSGAERDPEDESVISRLWSELDSPVHSLLHLDDEFLDAPPEYTELVEIVLDAAPPDDNLRQVMRKRAYEWVQTRLKKVVGKKKRGRYEDVAIRTVGVAETYRRAGQREKSRSLLENVRDEWSQYYAFTRELDRWRKNSPVVPDPECD